MRKFDGFLKGINLGGWLSQGSFEKDHLENFIVEADMEKVKAMGVDHVRLPIDYVLVEEEDGTPIESGFDYVDRCIAWCQKYELNMILDLHKTFGYAFDEAEDCKDFFHNKASQDRYVALWEKLAMKYGKYHDFVALEILNEIVDPDVSEIWNALAKRVMVTIRSYAPESYLIVGGTRYNSVYSVKELEDPIDDKVVFNFHCYEPIAFTHQAAYWVKGMPADLEVDYPISIDDLKEKVGDSLGSFFWEPVNCLDGSLSGADFFRAFFKEAIEVAEKKNVPLYCGEYGVIDKANLPSTINWYKAINEVFNEKGIGRAAWSYKGVDFGLTDEHMKDAYEEIIKYL